MSKDLYSIFCATALLVSQYSNAQTKFEGFVRNEVGEFIPDVYVVNMRTEMHAMTNERGFFTLDAEAGDSIVFSHLAYAFTFEIMPSEMDELLVRIVEMEPRNYLIDEVSVNTYKYETNRPRRMPLEEPNIPDEEQINYPADMAQPGIASPVDLLYYYFGSRPRQLRELRKLQAENAYRQQLREGNNREILMQITGLSAQELEAFAWSCKFRNQPISTYNDYDLLVSLLNCYQSYLKEQCREQILNESEQGW